MVRGEINEKAAYVQARSLMAKLKEKQNRQMKSSKTRTHENCEGSIDLEDKEFKETSRTRVRSLKHQWLLLCRVKSCKIVEVVHPTK